MPHTACCSLLRLRQDPLPRDITKSLMLLCCFQSQLVPGMQSDHVQAKSQQHCKPAWLSAWMEGGGGKQLPGVTSRFLRRRSHLQGMFNRTVRCLESGMKPVYVFDGKPPQAKSEELARRCAAHQVILPPCAGPLLDGVIWTVRSGWLQKHTEGSILGSGCCPTGTDGPPGKLQLCSSVLT